MIAAPMRAATPRLAVLERAPEEVGEGDGEVAGEEEEAGVVLSDGVSLSQIVGFAE